MEDKLIHKELSYKIRGLLFLIHNELGQYRNEKQYGDALEHKLKENKIVYEREKILPPSFQGEHNGRNKVDFLIENKVILELKHVSSLSKDDYFQCKRYLVTLNLELALLINFRTRYLMVNRILNNPNCNP